MNLETGETQQINAGSEYKILLLDKIDSNLICGFVAESDITTLIDGTVVVPMSKIEIATTQRKSKTYTKDGFYITGVEVKDNVIELYRTQKTSTDGRNHFVDATNDYIMNKAIEKTPFLQLTSRVTEAALTEYYLQLPTGYVIDDVPKVLTTANTIISQDPTLRLSMEEDFVYYTHIMGELEGAYNEAADAITIADEGVGVVRSNENHIVWERGVNANKSILSGFNNVQINGENSIESCIKILTSYMGKNIKSVTFDLSNISVYDILDKYLSEKPIRLTGVTLDQALYYVSKGRPIIAMVSYSDAVLIYGYDAYNIYMIDQYKENLLRWVYKIARKCLKKQEIFIFHWSRSTY